MINKKHIAAGLAGAVIAALALFFARYAANKESAQPTQPARATPDLAPTHTLVDYVNVAGLKVKFDGQIPLDVQEKLKATVLPVFGQFVETVSKITNYHGKPIFPFPPGTTLTIQRVMSGIDNPEISCAVDADKCSFMFFAGKYGATPSKSITFFEVRGRDEQGNPRNLDRLAQAPEPELIAPYSMKNMPPLIHDAQFARDVSSAIISAMGVDPRNFVITREEQISGGGYILPAYYIERTRIDKTIMSVSPSLQPGAPAITNYIIPAKDSGLAQPEFDIAIDLRTGTLMSYLDSARSALFGTLPLEKELKPMASNVGQERKADAYPDVLLSNKLGAVKNVTR